MDPGAVTYFEELARTRAHAMAVSVPDEKARVSYGEPIGTRTFNLGQLQELNRIRAAGST
jgi:hypothetical protein